jgi:hypothetical protein
LSVCIGFSIVTEVPRGRITTLGVCGVQSLLPRPRISYFATAPLARLLEGQRWECRRGSQAWVECSANGVSDEPSLVQTPSFAYLGVVSFRFSCGARANLESGSTPFQSITYSIFDTSLKLKAKGDSEAVAQDTREPSDDTPKETFPTGQPHQSKLTCGIRPDSTVVC